ncbi:plasmid mobilization relaxosome protein MobC [Flavobacterium sp. Fl-318]|uniref:Plasmid mobilization relaxosome protein MobC n=1 Tax=Flavobacterium cupriresistens TaxID=2893885 RepID=A0ABU4RHN8_9FLAO|nr:MULTISPECIES: plasmid mobilization relaxosome protein MobC [unclassified Flavobacterium]MDX6192081.1 plasmid mobilization relaxosome protein MobC [Flavobacterium sp. Fl-318]UFH44664.1 plasmid mobilization relaxosome protein MobC [Flavobacterium sp. F-323]
MMKRENSNRTRIVGLRFTPEEYSKIEKKWKASTCRKLSDYIRRHLFEKSITTIYRNQSLDDMTHEMMQLFKHLNGIGNNFNQAVKKLHTLNQIPEFKVWIISAELDKKILFDKMDEIKNYIRKISEKWLRS